MGEDILLHWLMFADCSLAYELTMIINLVNPNRDI